MNRHVTIILLAVALGLAACADTGRYPLGGDLCTEADPVKDIDAEDCTVPGS